MRPQTARPGSGRTLGVTLSVVNIPPLLPPVTSPESARGHTPLTPRLWSYTMSSEQRTALPRASSGLVIAGTQLKGALSLKSGVSSPLLERSIFRADRPASTRKRFPWHRIAIDYSGKSAKKPLRGKSGIRPLLYSATGKSMSEAQLPSSFLFSNY